MHNNKLKIKILLITLFFGILPASKTLSQEVCPFVPYQNGALILQTGSVTADFIGGMLGTFDQSASGNVTGGMDWFALSNQNRGTSHTGNQLISWWSRVDGRNTTLQVTNFDRNFTISPTVHVQIFGEDCTELRNFCDTYTATDNHIYDLSNLITNTGQVVNSANLAGREGIIVVTPVEECNISIPSFRAIVFPDWQGDVTITDATNGLDYHAKAWARRTDTLFSCTETTTVGGLTVLDGTGDCRFETVNPSSITHTFSALPGSIGSRSDVVLFSLMDSYGLTTYNPNPIGSVVQYFPGSVDENEIIESCALVTGCFLRLGINNIIPISDTPLPDSDMDGVLNGDDNCSDTPNPLQEDTDSDGTGDLCDDCPNDSTDSCDPMGSAAEEIDSTAGGTVQTADTNLTLEIPPNSVSSDTTISVTELMPGDPEADLVIGPNTGLGQIVAVYDLQPEGQMFSPPATLTIIVDVTSLNATQRTNLDLYIFNDASGSYESLGAVCTITEAPPGTFTAECTASVDHFTSFALIGPLDTDGDGIPDDFPTDSDECDESDLSESVIIDGCDSGVENALFENGCTISDDIMECADGAKNHGKFVSCVSKLANGLKKDGLISGKEKGAIQSCAAQADLP